MKNIETHGGFRWGPVERKLQISYSPLPPKFAVVAEDSPVSWVPTHLEAKWESRRHGIPSAHTKEERKQHIEELNRSA